MIEKQPAAAFDAPGFDGRAETRNFVFGFELGELFRGEFEVGGREPQTRVQALLRLFAGRNVGKQLVRVAG